MQKRASQPPCPPHLSTSVPRLDVGTNNEKYLKSPHYLGIQKPRLEGDEYFDLVDEFMSAVHNSAFTYSNPNSNPNANPNVYAKANANPNANVNDNVNPNPNANANPKS